MRYFASGVDPLAFPPCSLFYDRPFFIARKDVEGSFFGRLLLKIGGYYGEASERQRAANNLYDAVTEQAGNPKFYETMQLSMETLTTVHNVLGLHIWLLIKRVNAEEDKNGPKLIQLVYDHFLYDIEIRAHKAGLRVSIMLFCEI